MSRSENPHHRPSLESVVKKASKAAVGFACIAFLTACSGANPQLVDSIPPSPLPPPTSGETQPTRPPDTQTPPPEATPPIGGCNGLGKDDWHPIGIRRDNNVAPIERNTQDGIITCLWRSANLKKWTDKYILTQQKGDGGAPFAYSLVFDPKANKVDIPLKKSGTPPKKIPLFNCDEQCTLFNPDLVKPKTPNPRTTFPAPPTPTPSSEQSSESTTTQTKTPIAAATASITNTPSPEVTQQSPVDAPTPSAPSNPGNIKKTTEDKGMETLAAILVSSGLYVTVIAILNSLPIFKGYHVGTELLVKGPWEIARLLLKVARHLSSKKK